MSVAASASVQAVDQRRRHGDVRGEPGPTSALQDVLASRDQRLPRPRWPHFF